MTDDPEPGYMAHMYEIVRLAQMQRMAAIDTAIRLGLEWGWGAYVDDRRHECRPDERIPAGHVIDVSACGIDAVRWGDITWPPLDEQQQFVVDQYRRAALSG